MSFSPSFYRKIPFHKSAKEPTNIILIESHCPNDWITREVMILKSFGKASKTPYIGWFLALIYNYYSRINVRTIPEVIVVYDPC